MNNQNSNLDNLNNEMNTSQNNGINNGIQNNVINNGVNIHQNNIINNNMNIPQNNIINNGMNVPQNNVINNGMNVPQNNDVYNSMNVPQNNGMNSKRINNKKIIFIVGLVVIVIIVIIIVFSFLKPKNNFESNSNDNVIEEDFSGIDSDYDEDKYTNSTSFFFQNEDMTYTLYDENGNKLSNEDFTSVSGFVNGIAAVLKDDNKGGLIKEDGTMLIDYEDVVNISNIGAFFVAEYEDPDDYTRYTKIYDSNGKVIKEGEQVYGVNLIINNYHRVSMISDIDNYYIYNYKGELVSTIPMAEAYSGIEANTNGSSYLIIYYNYKSYLINTNSKLLFTLDGEYYIEDVSKDGSKVLLIPSDDYYGYTDKKHYKLVKNGKVFSEFETDESLYFENNMIKGSLDLYDENGKIIKQGCYYDENNYVVENDDKYDLYENGKLKTTLNCERNIANTNNGLYLMKDCNKQDGLIYYKLDGTKLNNTIYEKAFVFDNYGIAIVSEDSEDYYLMNTNGEKSSKDYDDIELVYTKSMVSVKDTSANVYMATKNNEKILLNTDGKELVRGDEIEVNEYNFAIAQRDEDYEIVDIDKNKSVAIIEANPTLYKDYFTYEYNGEIKYCAYGSGNPFFEEQV